MASSTISPTKPKGGSFLIEPTTAEQLFSPEDFTDEHRAIARTTEEMLLLVPNTVREAAYGLGVSRWRTTLSITLRTATSGVITGIMLAFARVAGETAPLLFTAFGNQYWNWKINQPTAALSLQIFTYAISPFDEWHRQAWAGALILIVLIVFAVSAVRIVASRGMLKGAN